METLAKQWVDGLRGLGTGSVGLSEGVLVVREVKAVAWKSLRNIVLFRFRCGMFPNIWKKVDCSETECQCSSET